MVECHPQIQLQLQLQDVTMESVFRVGDENSEGRTSFDYQGLQFRSREREEEW